MSAPAQVTEAHRVLARHLSTEAESVPHLCDLMAQAIADSEARTIAGAVAPLEARIKSDEELFHDIRMKLTASCGDPYKLHDEALDAIIAERDQLRAEVERLTAELEQESKWKAREYLARAESAEREAFDWKKIARYEAARAERAEADLAFQVARNSDLFTQRDQIRAELDAERARMADLVADLNDACITLESAKNDCDDYAMQNTAFKLMAVSNVLLQYIPNAAMKEETK